MNKDYYKSFWSTLYDGNIKKIIVTESKLSQKLHENCRNNLFEAPKWKFYHSYLIIIISSFYLENSCLERKQTKKCHFVWGNTRKNKQEKKRFSIRTLVLLHRCCLYICDVLLTYLILAPFLCPSPKIWKGHKSKAYTFSFKFFLRQWYR